MRIVIPLLCACMIVGGHAEEVTQAMRCPVESGVLRDGGSILIKIPAFGDQPAVEIIEDRRRDAETPGVYYLYDNFGSEETKPMKPHDVLAAFDQAQRVLLAKYGKDMLFDLAMHPLVVGKNVTAEEYARRISDPKFIERIELSEILVRIQEYRSLHGSGQDASSKGQ